MQVVELSPENTEQSGQKKRRSGQGSGRRRRKRRKLRKLNLCIFIIIAITAVIVLIINLTRSPDETPKNSEAPSFVSSVIDEIREEVPQKIVAIDPGHGGGNSPGAVYGGVLERELVLIVAEMVRASLEELGYTVIMTREEDVYVSISERIEIAESNNAEALISIHYNALENDTVTEGMETLYNVAANELNATLAKYIQEETVRTTNAKDRGILANTAVMITRESKIPSCLIEVGFLSSDRERALLTSTEYQRKAAQGIVQGIEKFFENHVD